MNKLDMAMKILLALLEKESDYDADGIAGFAFELADAMQAEADKREPKGFPGVLQDDWQPDWSVAPSECKYWAMDADNSANFFKREPEITNNNGWDFGDVMQSDRNHTYQGDWKQSLRKRPQ